MIPQHRIIVSTGCQKSLGNFKPAFETKIGLGAPCSVVLYFVWSLEKQPTKFSHTHKLAIGLIRFPAQMVLQKIACRQRGVGGRAKNERFPKNKFQVSLLHESFLLKRGTFCIPCFVKLIWDLLSKHWENIMHKMRIVRFSLDTKIRSAIVIQLSRTRFSW